MKYLALPVHSLGGNWDVIVALLPWDEFGKQAKELLGVMRQARELRKEYDGFVGLYFWDNSVIFVEPTEALTELTFEMDLRLEHVPKTIEVSDEDIKEGQTRVETVHRMVSESTIFWGAYVKHADVLLETCMVSEDFLKECASCTAEP